jgi:glutamate-1-semialdehyde 2,1-aminomutase
MEGVSSGRVLHLGTYNGNPLVMAAAKAVLAEVCTPEATRQAIERNGRFLAMCDDTIAAAGLPAHTVQLGAKGCVTYSTTPVRNYRDYKATDFDLAFAHWIWGINRGILLPPGLDEQWLVSVLHTDDDIAFAADVFRSFVAELSA